MPLVANQIRGGKHRTEEKTVFGDSAIPLQGIEADRPNGDVKNDPDKHNGKQNPANYSEAKDQVIIDLEIIVMVWSLET
jgi:hypothetical protein